MSTPRVPFRSGACLNGLAGVVDQTIGASMSAGITFGARHQETTETDELGRPSVIRRNATPMFRRKSNFGARRRSAIVPDRTVSQGLVCSSALVVANNN